MKPHFNKGRKHTPEQREKNRIAHFGKKQSLETIQKRVLKLRGQKRTVVQRKKMSEWQQGSLSYWYGKTGANKGKRLSEETKKKLSDALKGRAAYNKKYFTEEERKAAAVLQQQNREARKKGNGGSYTIEQWNDLLKRVNYMCLCCKRHEPEVKLSVDHIIPISKGGRNDIANIQPLCFSCNARKGVKDIDYISHYFQVAKPV